MNVKKAFLQAVLFLCLCWSQLFSQSEKVSIENLKTIDEKWTLVDRQNEVHNSRVIYRNQKWLMYFIHWRELTEENKNISIAYADSILHNLWGMAFDPTKISGECSVKGHKAFFVETTFKNSIRTRFIVWNCEETGRQFVADCNINLRMQTPEVFFDLQHAEITPNLACHPSAYTPQIKLPQKVSYQHLDINFNLPQSWRSKEFLIKKDTTKQIPGYYLNGVTKSEGSIWNLLTDSEKQIELAWVERRDEEHSKSTLNHFVNTFESDTVIEMQDSIRIKSVYSDFRITDLSQNQDIIHGTGCFNVIVNIPAFQRTDTTQYLHKFYLWNEQDKTFFLLYSMVAYKDVWGLPFDLTPTKEQFNLFEEAHVFKIMNDTGLITKIKSGRQ